MVARTGSLIVGLLLLGGASVKAQRDCTAMPPPASPKLCCPFMDGGTVYNDTIYINCWERYSVFPMVPIRGGGISGGPAGCVSDCLFNALDLFYDRNYPEPLISLYALDSHVQEVASPERYPYVRTAIQYCVNEANRRAHTFAAIQREPNVIEGLDNCNPISGFAMSCMHAYAIRNCPNWTPDAQEGCDDLLDFYTQCPFNPY